MSDGSVLRRSTKQRQAILTIVEHSTSHPSAEEVFQVVRQEMPQISLATVYRNLRLLVEEGKIREVQFRGDVLRYDGMLDPHEHFCCRSCGRVFDLPASLPRRMVTNLENDLGAAVEFYSLDYYGTCRSCRESGK